MLSRSQRYGRLQKLHEITVGEIILNFFPHTFQQVLTVLGVSKYISKVKKKKNEKKIKSALMRSKVWRIAKSFNNFELFSPHILTGSSCAHVCNNCRIQRHIFLQCHLHRLPAPNEIYVWLPIWVSSNNICTNNCYHLEALYTIADLLKMIDSTKKYLVNELGVVDSLKPS